MLEAWALQYIREDAEEGERRDLADKIVAQLKAGVPFVQLVSLFATGLVAY
jgi:hypothetical protein